MIDDLDRQDVGCRVVAGQRAVRKTESPAATQTAAQAVGKAIAERAIAAGVKAVCFDRGPYRYHGRVAALADAAREGGLSF